MLVGLASQSTLTSSTFKSPETENVTLNSVLISPDNVFPSDCTTVPAATILYLLVSTYSTAPIVGVEVERNIPTISYLGVTSPLTFPATRSDVGLKYVCVISLLVNV